MKKIKDHRQRSLILIIPILFMAGFYFLPMASILGHTFASTRDSFSTNPINWTTAKRVVNFTFYQAFLSTFITLMVGIPSSYLFGRFSFRGKNFLRILSTLPFILPTVVVAGGLNALIGPNGWLNLLIMDILKISTPPIRLLNSLPAILIAHVFYNTSIVIRIVGTAWEQLDQKLEEAALMLGAAPNVVFWKVTFPLLLPSILSATILVFLFDFTSFGVILMMGGAAFSTIEVEIYIQAVQFLNLKMAGILSLIQLAFSMLLTFLSLHISGEKNITIIPMVEGEGLKKPDSFIEKLFVYTITVILVILLISPTAALLLKSISASSLSNSEGGVASLALTIENYRGLFFNDRHSLFFVPPITALRNSILFAAASMITALFLGILISVSSSRNERINKYLDLLVMLPLGTSAVTLGLGYLTAFSSKPYSIRWFPILIPMIHALIALPFVIRIIQPVIHSIPENLHEAAMTLGVPKRQLWKYVDLPLIRKSLATAAIYAFAISLGEFGATSFLARPEYPTLPIAIFRYLNLPGGENYGKAMAMASILLIICGCGFLIIERLQIKVKGEI